MENQKQVEETKSNGIELLENVIKTNRENIEHVVSVQFDIEDLTSLLNEMNFKLQNIVLLPDKVLALFKLEQVKRTEFIASIPTKIEAVLSNESRDYLESFQKNIKWRRKFIWTGIGVFAFGILALIASINFATNWYKESIKAKSELRQDILNEIASEGNKIYDENEMKVLSENTKLMQLWIKNNPKKAEDFLRFKDGYEASKESK